MIDKIIEAAHEAGSILLAAAQSGVKVSKKSRHELVTTADLLSEKLLKTRLLEIEPKAGFLGEESWEGNLPVPPFWIVDPLDGTNNYAHGYPVWAVSIAYWNGSDVEYGCVYDPGRNETFSASRGSGTWMNGRQIFSTSVKDMSDCIFATGFPYHRSIDDPGMDLDVLRYFLGRVQGIRRGGSAALDLAYVSCGRIDGFWEEHLKPWDMAAGFLLVEESGGKVSSYKGEKWVPFSEGVVASGNSVHRTMLQGIKNRQDR
ncbi:MAG: inositol monophosphatase [Candidatus Aegiribacteria sp.]|nr:inositol monophosphatase [Candidatus Aegiribacteria sp.]